MKVDISGSKPLNVPIIIIIPCLKYSAPYPRLKTRLIEGNNKKCSSSKLLFTIKHPRQI